MAKYHIFEIQVKKADYRSITPRQYRLDNLKKHPSMVARKKARV